MADEQKKPGEGDDLFGESGLGNLPPLSDFDSQAGFTSDHESLPPLSGFDAAGDSGGLPPLSDIESETPLPRQPDRGKPMTFDSGPTAIDTPAPSRLRTPGTGFQDIAADSDFSPETPEIGPGPDSNVDTPMFDSAFGGGDQDFDVSVKTPAPTQAMETPMFGEQGGFGGGFGGGGGAAGGGFGFDEGAFGAGTPAPDFSPDTEMRRPGGAGPGAFPEPPAAPAPKKRGGSVGVLVGVLIALIIGLVAAPYLSPYIPFLPNPLAEEVRAKDQTIAQQKKQIDEFKTITDQGVGKVSQEELSRLTTEIAAATETLGQKNVDLERAATDLTARREELDLVERDLAAKSEEFALAQAAYEDLLNATAITQARQKGLASEVERLTNLVGELDAANARRAATKESLEHNIDRLLIQVKESLPLTPDKYSHAGRIAAVETLRDKVSDAKWVTPDLLQEYTSLYLKELEISQQEEYFFAKMPVVDKFGNNTQKWAEALMLGNRAVYYRSLDGRNIGMYTNIGTAESPQWDVQEIEDKALRAGIESRVFEARVPGFADKLQYLAERELSEEEGTPFQRAYSSL